jgi:hypothetical protein
MLRAVFKKVERRKEGEEEEDCPWVQSIPPAVEDREALFEFIDLLEVGEEQKMAALELEMDKQHKSFDITKGRPFLLPSSPSPFFLPPSLTSPPPPFPN